MNSYVCCGGTERRHRAFTSLSKIYRSHTVLEEPEASYASLLTPHAFKTVSKNVKAAPAVQLVNNENLLQNCIDHQCRKGRSTSRRSQNTSQNTTHTYRITEKILKNGKSEVSCSSASVNWTSHSHISECGEEECSDRMDNLKSLVELWEAGKKTTIVEVVQEQMHIQAAAAILAEETSTPAIEIVEDTANTHTEAIKDVQQPDEDIQLFLEESTQVPPTTTRTDENMKLPPKRGRPKGSQQTVIGLKRRRLATGPPLSAS